MAVNCVGDVGGNSVADLPVTSEPPKCAVEDTIHERSKTRMG